MAGGSSRCERIYEPTPDAYKGGRTDVVVINVSRLVHSFEGKLVRLVLRGLCW